MSENDTPKKPELDEHQQWVATNAPSIKKWVESVATVQDTMAKPAAAGFVRE